MKSAFLLLALLSPGFAGTIDQCLDPAYFILDAWAPDGSSSLAPVFLSGLDEWHISDIPTPPALAAAGWMPVYTPPPPAPIIIDDNPPAPPIKPPAVASPELAPLWFIGAGLGIIWISRRKWR
jgi:hypothetical protein